MPRAIWSGAISFGLVNVPVKVYSAISRKTVRFHQLHDKDGVPIRQKRVCPAEDDEVPYEHIVKGYEFAKGQFVVITPEELEALDPKKTRTIDIQDFVRMEEIDPIFYDSSYYLAPASGAEKAYALLLQAMKDSGKVAIGRVVIRTKEYLAAIRATDDVLTLSTMVFGDEVVDRDSLDELPASNGRPSKREVEMAERLIESLSVEFDPDRYQDEYRERVLELIERKAAGEEISVAPPEREEGPTPDLMAALEASLQEASQDAGSNGAGKKKKTTRTATRSGSKSARKQPAKRSAKPKRTRAKAGKAS